MIVTRSMSVSLDPGDGAEFLAEATIERARQTRPHLFSGDDRPSGLHLSGVLRGIINSNKAPDAEWKSVFEMSKREKAEFYARTEIGFIWEELLSHYFKPRMLRRRLMQPDPPRHFETQVSLLHDGIWMTLDALDYDSDPPRLEEYKATTMGIQRWFKAEREERVDEEFWRWMSQIKGYLKGAGLRHARLYPLWLVGDWAGSGTTMTVHDLEFTQDEIDANWDMIQHAAAGLGNEYKEGQEGEKH